MLLNHKSYLTYFNVHPLIDLLLIFLTYNDLANNNEPTFMHGLSFVYIGYLNNIRKEQSNGQITYLTIISIMLKIQTNLK